MKPIPKYERAAFKLLVGFLSQSDSAPFKQMQEFADKYAINIDEMRIQLRGSHRIHTITTLRSLGYLD